MSGEDWRRLSIGGQSHYGEWRDLGVGAFGPNVVVHLDQQVLGYLERASDDRAWLKVEKLGAAVTVSNGGASLATGTTAQARARLRTVASSAYVPGSGIRAFWTVGFPSGSVADCVQFAGLIHEEGGLGVGYPGDGSGLSFLFLRGRRIEVRKVTITTPAGGAETVTVVLNSSSHAVSVTAGTAAHNAKQIADFASGYADTSGLYDWKAYALGSSVYFVRAVGGTATGTYSVTSTGALVASVTQFQAGAAGEYQWTPQAQWSIDPCDGSGPSRATVDGRYGAIWSITWGWLGYLGPVLWVSDPRSQRLIPAHFEPWAGTSLATGPTIADPRLPITYQVESQGSTTNVSIRGESCAVFLEDGGAGRGPDWTASASKASIGTTEIPLMSIMVAPVNLRTSTVNRRRLIVDVLSVANTGGKAVQIGVYIGTQANLTGSNFASADDDEALWLDTSASAITGTLQKIDAPNVAATASHEGPLPGGPRALYAGQVLIITGVVGSATTDVELSVSGSEDP